ncbi:MULTISPECIES: rRNA maturation RNase YbeY [Bacillaceae]|uniref:rRNA maturation RNase YbeY n=1 Tax=Bacillaceae TaxID=186817 RepID=UPI000E746DE5|nr:rRNA maturation RNase YbeY [Bacillus sp. PK3_68]RJS59730.1 rRNA maturation RNase YbeY [Bacillus sp. PK3_68]
MSLIIDMVDETEELKAEAFQLVEALLELTAEKEAVAEDSEVSITFTNNPRIQEINREYRGKDTPTDVISFALEEMGEEEIEISGAEGLPRVLGDIVISVERAKEQAVEYGHSFERELGFLAVHGLLHLLGYDHMTEEEEKVMFQKQKEILNEYGLQR